MKIRIVISRGLVSFAFLASSLLFVARPANAISANSSEKALIASENGQYTSALAEGNAFTPSRRLVSGNIMPGPRVK